MLFAFVEDDPSAFSPFTGMVSALMVLAKRLAPSQQQEVAGLLYCAADRLAVASLEVGTTCASGDRVRRERTSW